MRGTHLRCWKEKLSLQYNEYVIKNMNVDPDMC
jgi:hypothetical protein